MSTNPCASCRRMTADVTRARAEVGRIARVLSHPRLKNPARYIAELATAKADLAERKETLEIHEAEPHGDSVPVVTSYSQPAND